CMKPGMKAMLAVLACALGDAKTSLQIVWGSGEFVSYETAIVVSGPEAIQLRWSTDAAAAGGSWRVTKEMGRGISVVATGTASPAPKPGAQALFEIPANAFLQTTPPSPPGVKYSITIQPYNVASQPIDAASSAVS